jgi:hypothetical protein
LARLIIILSGVFIAAVVFRFGKLGGVFVRRAGQESRHRAGSRGWPLLTRIFGIGAVLVATVFSTRRGEILVVSRRLVLVFWFLGLRRKLPKRRRTRHRWRLGVPRLRRVGLLGFVLVSPLTSGRGDIIGHRPPFSGLGLAFGVRVRLPDQPGQFRQRVIRVACRGARTL